MNNIISRPIPPVWNSESRILILGTMPSPKSREAGFFYMHPQNRFWSVITEVFGETLAHPNNSPDISAAITERRDFLLRHHHALWDVLTSCEITGAADCLPSTSPANAQWSKERLINEYKPILSCYQSS